MSNVYRQRFMSIIQNLPQQWQSFTTTSCFKHLDNNSLPTSPVKLAYASYESTKGTETTPKLPVMIMHGLFGSKNNWNSLSKAIHQKTERKVITVDARNHGDSPHTAEMTYKHMAGDIVQLLKDLQYEKAIFVGHSMGGSTMMYVALHYPEIVEKLVVVDMSPIRCSPALTDMGKIFQAMRSVKLEGSTSLSKARKMAEEQLATTIKPLALRQFLMMNLVEAEDGRYKWRINLPVLEQNFPTQIAVFPKVESKVFAGPTLFIGGSNSDYILVQDHGAIRNLFPSAKFYYISGANHWVHADKPEEFLDVLTSFINQAGS